MSNRAIKQIIIAVFMALFWQFLSYFSNNNIGIYAGLGGIFALILVNHEEDKP